jgi:Family of unknown function (DUF6489)
MKVRIDIDCTAEEARAFFGLPDLGPMQQEFVGAMQERLKSTMSAMDPEALMKTWMSSGPFWAPFGDSKKK